MKDKKQSKKKIYVSALVLTVLASLGLAVGRVSAWGPERTTWTMANPADYATYNSITDNTSIGDERNFVRVRELTAADDTNYSDEVHVSGGKDYEVWIYYHNNAATIYNSSDYSYKGVAQKTRVMAKFPDALDAGQSGDIYGQIYSVTATPTDVWDEAKLIADEKVTLSYVTGSAKIYNARLTDGLALNSDELFSNDGTYIGVTNMNGMIPGCAEYSGRVVYRIHAERVVVPSSTFEMDKTISVDDGATWADNAALAPGAEAEFRIVYKNTGTLAQTVTATDTFENGIGMEYVAGSTKIIANGTETMVQDENGGKLFNGGVLVGEIAPGGTVEIRYKVKIKEASQFVCGKTVLYNLAGVSTQALNADGTPNGGTATQTDKVRIDVTRDDSSCLPGELPNTGPAEIVLSGVIIAGLIVGIYFYVHSSRTLKKLEAEANGEKLEKPKKM